MKKYIFIIIAVIVAFVAYKVNQLVKWYDALGIGFSGKPKTVRNSNLVLACKVKLDNPKGFSMTITKPTIRIFNKGELIASSDPSNEKIKIAANTLTVIDYEINVPIQGNFMQLLLSLGSSAYSQIMSGNITNLSLGQTFDVIAYMQFYGIERTWKNKLTV